MYEVEHNKSKLLWEDSSSDEEVEDALPLRRRAARIFRERVDHFSKWSEEEFRKRFRLSKYTVRALEQKIGNDIAPITNRNHPIPASLQILILLRFCATGCILQTAGDIAGIHSSTAGQIVRKVARKIAELSQDHIYMPRTVVERDTVLKSFYTISKFPRVLGAIDCTHVKIQSPGGNEAELFRNRKGYFSINVQAVSDASLFIRSIVARWPGSSHDQTIFNNSRIKARFESGEFGNSVLLGDSGYGLQSYLITPLLNPTTAVENMFNEAQIRSRNPVERLFGVWKRRFPILSLGMRVSIPFAQNIIVACAVLHNIARSVNEPEFEPDVDMPYEDNENNDHQNTVVNHRTEFLLYFQKLLHEKNM